jgi:hypothetical protein
MPVHADANYFLRFHMRMYVSRLAASPAFALKGLRGLFVSHRAAYDIAKDFSEFAGIALAEF